MEISEQELHEIRNQARIKAEGSHDWIQSGPWIRCRSCEITHASWIGAAKKMVGKDEKGVPIIEDWVR